MTTTVGWYTPMLRVAEIERSIPFYELLGFELIDTDRCEPIGWARMHCQGGALMLLRGGPTNPKAQTVMFYMYTPDLPAFRKQLVEKGITVSPIEYPDHGPSGEVYLDDPDGYHVGIMHWSDKEHTEWLQRIGREAI